MQHNIQEEQIALQLQQQQQNQQQFNIDPNRQRPSTHIEFIENNSFVSNMSSEGLMFKPDAMEMNRMEEDGPNADQGEF